MSGGVPDAYWKHLLNMTTSTGSEGTNVGEPPRPLNTEDRTWLETVMSELVEDTDLGRQLEKTMDGLKMMAEKTDLSEEDTNKLRNLVARLEDILQYADFTPAFIRDGGLFMIEKFMGAENLPEVRVDFVQCIVTACENNGPAQEAVAKGRLFKLLLVMAADHSLPQSLRLKLLGAISAVVRSNCTAFDELHSLGGMQLLLSLISDPQSPMPIAAKCARILASLAFTLVDFPDRVAQIHPFVANGYAACIDRNMQSESLPELEYVVEYMAASMTPKDLDDSAKKSLINAVNAHQKNCGIEELKQPLEQLSTKLVS